MKHLVIKNFGPVRRADLRLKRVNLIVGPQSSGKSCVLKIACYCTWVEKRIELAHDADEFGKGSSFLERLVNFYKLDGYVYPDTYVGYESDFMAFSFDNAREGDRFRFEWKKGEWGYRRPKVAYIPAERNMVAAVPNWYNVKLDDNYIREFISEWSDARKAAKKDVDVLNLGVKYHYDKSSDKDRIIERNGRQLDLTNASSGLQSLIPMFVYLNYLRDLFSVERPESLENVAENDQLLRRIYDELFVKTGRTETVTLYDHIGPEISVVPIGRFRLLFSRMEDARECMNVYSRFTKTKFCDIFLEEPEENLFPPTQDVLVKWLLETVDGDYPGNLFISTHSPYVVTSFLEEKDLDPGLFLTGLNGGGGITLRKATRKQIQDIYDYGMDVFFNNEYFG